jgi:hypothetical protein
MNRQVVQKDLEERLRSMGPRCDGFRHSADKFL